MIDSPPRRAGLVFVLLLCLSFSAQAAQATSPESFLATHNMEAGCHPPPTEWASS